MSNDTFAPLPHGEPRRFQVEFAKDDIDELQSKLRMVRWGPPGGLLPEGDPRTDFGLLPTPALLNRFVEAWKVFDFDAAAQSMNRQEHFLVDIDWCKPLHYVHRRSSRADAMPIILIHGWPGSFYEFWHVIDKLAEPDSADDPAFHVVVPSLPGYAWSKGPPTKERGVGDTDGYCRILDTLMHDVLGYEAYASQGGDWGSTHARCLAAKYARPDGKTGCRAVHLNFSPLVPKFAWALSSLPQWLTDAASPYLPGEIGTNLRKLMGFHKSMAYYWIQQMRPQQLAPALTDSPVGLLAWLGFFWGIHLDATPTFNTDAMLSIATVYFVTRSIGTSFLPYHNNDFLTDMHGDKQYNVRHAALGYSDFPREIANVSHKWLKATGDLRFYVKATKGGHFAALEEPQIFVNHLRVAFALPNNVAMQKTRKDPAALAKLDIRDAKITGSMWFDASGGAGRKSHL